MSTKIAYSIAEAAEAASISVSILRRMIANNEISVRYVGTKPIILAEEFTAWAKSLPSEAPAK